jgi:hypothetical protein
LQAATCEAGTMPRGGEGAQSVYIEIAPLIHGLRRAPSGEHVEVRDLSDYEVAL